MNMEELLVRARDLETTIRTAPLNRRLDLQPEFSGVLTRIRNSGGRVSGRLSGLEQVLNEELAESRFDNMPV